MTRHVAGVLFVDYVRMLRNHGGRSLAPHLNAEDLPYLEAKVDPGAWYPMATFERFGLAILKVVAEGNLQHVRVWGQVSASRVAASVPDLLVPGDPRESLMRLQVFRRCFFDFEALSILQISDTSADVWIGYGMSPAAEEAACIQTLGFFEGLVELAHGTSVKSSFPESAWVGDRRTVLSLGWHAPASSAAPRPLSAADIKG